MPQEPKKRHSRERKGKRRASIHLTNPMFLVCPNCKQVTLPHMVCKKCGFYEGKKVLDISTSSSQKRGSDSRSSRE